MAWTSFPAHCCAGFQPRAAAACVSWLVLNISLQLINKWMLCSGFRAPVFVILTGTGSTFVLLGGFAVCRQFCCRRRIGSKHAAGRRAAHGLGVGSRGLGVSGSAGGGVVGELWSLAADGDDAGSDEEMEDLLDLGAVGGSYSQSKHERIRPSAAHANQKNKKNSLGQPMSSSSSPSSSSARGGGSSTDERLLAVLLETARPYLEHSKMLFLLGTTHGLATAFENMSIAHMSVATNQIIKATAPMFTLFALVLDRRRRKLARISSELQAAAGNQALEEGRNAALNIRDIPAVAQVSQATAALRGGAQDDLETDVPLSLKLCTFVVVVGAVMGVFRNPDANFVGLTLAGLSMFIGLFQVIVTERLMQQTSLPAAGVAFVSTLPALVILAPMAVALEGSFLHATFGGGLDGVISLQGDPCNNSMGEMKLGLVVFLICMMAVMGCLYNLAHFYVIELTSAHYFLLAGNAKIILVILVSVSAFPPKVPYSGVNIAGFVVGVVGFCAYNYLLSRHKAQQRASASNATTSHSFSGRE